MIISKSHILLLFKVLNNYFYFLQKDHVPSVGFNDNISFGKLREMVIYLIKHLVLIALKANELTNKSTRYIIHIT